MSPEVQKVLNPVQGSGVDQDALFQRMLEDRLTAFEATVAQITERLLSRKQAAERNLRSALDRFTVPLDTFGEAQRQVAESQRCIGVLQTVLREQQACLEGEKEKLERKKQERAALAQKLQSIRLLAQEMPQKTSQAEEFVQECGRVYAGGSVPSKKGGHNGHITF